MEQNIIPRKTYFLVYLALLVLLGLTITAHFFDLGIFNPIISLAVAAAKATLVILFFMHVKISGPASRLFVFAGFVWLAILIGLTLTDYLSRVGGL